MPDHFSLEHAPLGLEHPYLHEPHERSPRQPLAGQPVTLGAVTRPAGAARRVWAAWTVDGGPAGEAEGRPVEVQAGKPGQSVPVGPGERDCWQVTLPAFACGQQVEYYLHASDGQSNQQAGPFSFTVLDWQASQAHVACVLTSAGLQLDFGGQPACLSLEFAAPDQLHFDLAAGMPPAAPEGASSAIYSVLESSPKRVVLATSALRLCLELEPYRLSIQRPDGTPVLEQDAPPAWLGAPGVPLQSARLAFLSPPDEGFYGFGERFNAFNQRGSRPDVCVFAEFTEQGLHSYIPVPFFLSSRGYGFWQQTARRVSFDLAATDPQRWSFDLDLGSETGLSFDLFAGPTPLENLRAFATQSGLPALPPTWVFGPWMSGNEWNSQAEVMRQVELTRQHAIPASVLVIEAWSDESTFYIWNDAQYIPHPEGAPFHYADFTFPADGKWPDPKGMIDALHAQGIRLVLWQIPALKEVGAPHPQHDLDTDCALRQGYCVRNPDGSPYRIRPFWFHDGYLWDPTHPAGRDWWLEQRAYLLDELGVDGFKTDGGEHLWGQDVTFANGLRADEGLNQYPNLYVGAYHQFAERKRPGQTVTFSRAGFSGAQAFPCHWAGDQKSTWAEFRAVLRAGLSAGLSAIPFWGWDIGGFAGPVPGAELYLRAAAMAAFTPVMQYHSDFFEHQAPSHDRTPWNIADLSGQPQVIEIYRKFARLRLRLAAYIESEAAYTAASGEPLMRPLFLDWPADPQAWQIEDQYSFGRSLLVAPVQTESASQRRVYLPAGDWADVWTGARLSGPVWVDWPAPLDSIPVFQRLDRPGPNFEIWNQE
jgi:alpha-glucosidase (family GH31 glycosyl hydrolase)